MADVEVLLRKLPWVHPSHRLQLCLRAERPDFVGIGYHGRRSGVRAVAGQVAPGPEILAHTETIRVAASEFKAHGTAREIEEEAEEDEEDEKEE